MKFYFCWLLFFVQVKSHAQNEDSVFIRRMADEILVHGKAYEDLRVLTKQIGGRLAGSPQMVKAEQWGLFLLKSLHPDKAWLQPCQVPHWVRGGKDAAVAIVKNGSRTLGAPKPLAVLALGNSLGTGPGGLQGPVIEIKDFQELEKNKQQLKGKIVFYNHKFDQRFIRTFMAYSEAVAYRGAGPSKAAQYGAKGVIVRSMSESTDNFPHTGSLHYNDSFAKIPAVAIGLKDADWLENSLKQDQVFITIKTSGHFLADTIGHNVIAELKGSQMPEEFITLGGHLDSWDPGEGAHDDGTGVVQTIEVLRVLQELGYKPRHTLRFVLFANEENGARGGSQYAQQAMINKERHLFALESDAGGFTPRGFGFAGSEDRFQKIVSWLSLLSPYGATEVIKGGGGTDIEPLAEIQGTALGSFMPDSQRYFDIHHTKNDVFENVNKRELELGAVDMAALLYLVDKYGL